MTDYMCQEKNEEEVLASIEDGEDTLIRRHKHNIKKKLEKIYYRNRKQHKQHKDQQNNNNLK